MERNMDTWTNLPDCVWERVVSFLDFASITSFSLVNREWRYRAWEYLCNCVESQSLDERSYSILINKLIERPHDRRLVRRVFLNFANDYIKPEQVLTALTSFASLQELHLMGCCLSIELGELVGNLTSLTSISIIEPVLEDPDALSALTKLTNLRSLALRMWEEQPPLYLLNTPELATSLTQLDLSHCEDVDNAMTSSICFYRNLTSLQLCGCPVENSCLENISKKLTHLKELNLSGTRITTPALTQLQRLANLERLDISYCNVKPMALNLLTNIQRLRYLSAISCWSLSPSEIEAALPGVVVQLAPL